MVVSITPVPSLLNVLVNIIMICYSRSQISERYHIFEAFISYLHIMVLSWTMVTRHEHSLHSN